MNLGTQGRRMRAAVPLAVAVLALGACSAGDLGDSDDNGGASGSEGVEITYLVDNAENTVATAEAVADAFMGDNPDITVTVETRPQGADGDNAVKTRLATGEMEDVFGYNSAWIHR
ncbi:MAG TPA: hypothetical protein VIK12_03450 [Pengzhenrongella sp.]